MYHTFKTNRNKIQEKRHNYITKIILPSPNSRFQFHLIIDIIKSQHVQTNFLQYDNGLSQILSSKHIISIFQAFTISAQFWQCICQIHILYHDATGWGKIPWNPLDILYYSCNITNDIANCHLCYCNLISLSKSDIANCYHLLDWYFSCYSYLLAVV